jgi:hypothetical protein
MKLIARFIPMAFLLGACMYAQQPQDPQQQPTTPQQPSTTQPATPAPSTAPSTDMPSSQQSTPAAPQTPAASENQPSQDQPKADVTITGKVVKSKGSLVIHDDASNSTYKVDNEDQLKQFMGKNVKVTGTLDAATKTIHISNVEVAAS